MASYLSLSVTAMEFWDSLIRMVSALAVVVGLMMALAAVARRVMGGRALALAETPLVRVVGSGYLGPRKNVALVAVAGDVLIIGTTATDLVPLGKVSDPEQVRRILARGTQGETLLGRPSGSSQPEAGRPEGKP